TSTTDTTIPQVKTIGLVKTATPVLSTPAKPGDKITYSLQVTNTGNVTLTATQVTDALIGYNNATCNGVTTLAPGASTTCSADYTITQEIGSTSCRENSATACANPPSGDAVCGTGTTDTTILQVKSIGLVKTATPAL